MSDQPFIEYDADVPTCPEHGYELEPDGYCEGCWLEGYRPAYCAEDAEDEGYERWRDRDYDAAA